MNGIRIGIITMGGSWGVALTDCLEVAGLRVPELSRVVQKRLRNIGMPLRASTRNPVDMGAIGFTSYTADSLVEMGRILLSSGEVDALVFHGLGSVQIEEDGLDQKKSMKLLVKEVLIGYHRLEGETGRPVLIGNALTKWESQAVQDLYEVGIRVYHQLGEIAFILSLMYRYWRTRR